MSRPHKPWYRAPRKTWYVEIDGKQIVLARGPKEDTRKEAYAEFNRLMETVDLPDGTVPADSVVSVLGKFLGWIKRNKSEATYQQLRHFLKSFVKFKKVRYTRPSRVTIELVESWLDAHPTWKSSRRHAIQSLLHAFNWAVKRKKLSRNPITGIEIPAKTRITAYLTREQRQTIYKAGRGKPFKNFLTAMELTGCRPGEVAAVTAADVDLAAGTWTLKRHKTRKKTGKARVVYLADGMLALTRELVAANPTGPIFLNQDRKPWTRQAIRCRFRNLRKKFPAFGYFTAYSFRRAYVTDALERGVDVAHVAELVGHTSTEMVMRFYSQLQERTAHMREMANKAAG